MSEIPGKGDWVRTRMGVIFRVGKRTRSDQGKVFLWCDRTNEPFPLEQCQNYNQETIAGAMELIATCEPDCYQEAHQLIKTVFNVETIKRQLWTALSPDLRAIVRRMAEASQGEVSSKKKDDRAYR